MEIFCIHSRIVTVTSWVHQSNVNLSAANFLHFSGADASEDKLSQMFNVCHDLFSVFIALRCILLLLIHQFFYLSHAYNFSNGWKHISKHLKQVKGGKPGASSFFFFYKRSLNVGNHKFNRKTIWRKV